MNLIVDIGNSSTKLAVYDGWNKITSFRVKELNCDNIEKKLSSLHLKKSIISSVKKIPPFLYDLLTVNIPIVHILTHKSKLPFTIEYETPDTLGTDRIAAVAGAFRIFQGKDVLIIDAGTAITFDFLTGTRYFGGNISPGIEMRFMALNKFTGNLPLVNRSEDFSFPGKNTADAITAGVITGVTYEINEYIRTFEKEHKDFKVILTGGDSSFLKDKIFYNNAYIPDIVIDGLNYILEYNAT